MQLVAYGAQDVYLTGDPMITFFKVVYRRHTNFAMEAIEQTFNGTVGLGNKVTAIISRSGDLLYKMYLETVITSASIVNSSVLSGMQRFGHAMIDYIELEIGGQLIDKHYGEWLDIWAQLTHTEEQFQKLRALVDGRTQQAQNSSNNIMYVPLQFWFNRNPGLALPLIALQYHEVKINIQFNTLSYLQTRMGSNGLPDDPIVNATLYADYIFLDTDERRRFAQVSHEYLIEQLQYNGQASISASATVDHELRFNHPVKELVWVNQLSGSLSDGPFSFLNSSGNDTYKKAKLKLNGHDRFRERDATYFRLVQPYQHHTGGHHQGATIDVGGITNGLDEDLYDMGGINVYSFALKPEEHQPSGTCNFSRIDNAVLQITNNSEDTNLRVYAVNYNVLRIMSGMGGVAYSN